MSATNGGSAENMEEERNDDIGCMGPDSTYIKLISSDNHEFIIKRSDALASATIRAVLSGPGWFSENESNVIRFKEMSSHVIEKVCLYLMYKVRYTGCYNEVIPEFHIAPEIAAEMLRAATFLDC